MKFKSKSQRQSKTFKMNCNFFIKLQASESEKSLEIISTNLIHEGHDHTQDLNEAIDLIKSEYNASVSVLCAEERNFEAFYFCTEAMRHSLGSLARNCFY